MRVAHLYLNLFFLSDVSHFKLDDISRLRVVLRISCLGSLVYVLFELLLRSILLHDQSCDPLAAEADLKRRDSRSRMHWKDVVNIQPLLAAVVVCLREFDISEALHYLHVIVEALQR